MIKLTFAAFTSALLGNQGAAVTLGEYDDQEFSYLAQDFAEPVGNDITEALSFAEMGYTSAGKSKQPTCKSTMEIHKMKMPRVPLDAAIQFKPTHRIKKGELGNTGQGYFTDLFYD